MMKRLLYFTTALLVALSMARPECVAAASIVKIGILDLQSALNATSEGMAAKETLRRKHLAKQEEIDAMQAELVSMEEKLKSPVLSEDAQAELKQKFREMQGELIEFVGRAKEAEEKENQALSGRILEGLVDIAREIGQKEGYTVIFEKSSSGVIFAEDTLSLTERVVKIYNEQNQGGSGN